MTVSLPELSRRATVDKSDFTKYSIKSWINSVSKLFEAVKKKKCQEKRIYTGTKLFVIG